MKVKVKPSFRPFWDTQLRSPGDILEVPDDPFKKKPAKWMLPIDEAKKATAPSGETRKEES